MRTLVATWLIGGWLVVSAFVLRQTPSSAWNVLLVGVIVCAVGLLAFAAPGRPGVRYANAVLALWLVVAAIFFPHASAVTALHDITIAMVLCVVSLIPPRRSEPPAPHGGPAPPAHSAMGS